MGIIVNLDVMMAKRKISAGDLAERVGITPANLSILKNHKAKAIRFSTLEAICDVLDCQPGDIIEYRRTSGAEYRAKNITDNPADIPDTAHPDCSKNSK